MVTAGEQLGNTVEGNEQCYLDWQLGGQSIPGNYSLIYWQFGWHFTSYSCRQLSNAYVSIDGADRYYNGGIVHSYSGGHNHKSGSGKLQIASGSLTMVHENDGSRMFHVYAWLVGYNNKKSTADGWFILPTIPRNPGAPSTPILTGIGQTTVDVSWSPNPGDGLPNTLYTISYGTNTDATGTTTTSSSTSKTITGLDPSKRYYFKVKAQNSVGEGPYSGISNVLTIAGAYVKYNGIWTRAVPYVRTGGVWTLARPWAKNIGLWKRSSN